MSFDDWLSKSFLPQEMDVPRERAEDYAKEAYDCGFQTGREGTGPSPINGRPDLEVSWRERCLTTEKKLRDVLAELGEVRKRYRDLLDEVGRKDILA
jgi:hypothetical protein